MSALRGQEIDWRGLAVTDSSYIASGGETIGLRALGLSITLSPDSPWIAVHAGLTSTGQLREVAAALVAIADQVEGNALAPEQVAGEGQDFRSDPIESTSDVPAPARALAELRRQADLSIAEAASIAGVSSGYLERVESGAASPSAAWLARVSAQLVKRV